MSKQEIHAVADQRQHRPTERQPEAAENDARRKQLVAESAETFRAYADSVKRTSQFELDRVLAHQG